MANFVLIFVCFILGIFFRRYKFFPPNAPLALNRFVIYVSLPALTLAQIHRLDLSSGSLLVPVSMPWLTYIMGFAFFHVVGKRTNMPKKTIGTLTLTGSLGNTSFVGFPLLEALFGAGAIAVGILVDQPGSFLIAGSLGVASAAYYAGGSVHPKHILKKIFSFPPFLSLLVAFPLRAIELPPEAFHVLDRLGATLIPLALVSVGMQLHFHPEKIKANFKYLCWGLGYKLFLVPLVCTLVYLVLFQQHNQTTLITLVEAAMAPMITAGIIAAEYDLDIELANLMVGLGIPISLATAPAWAWVLGHWF